MSTNVLLARSRLGVACQRRDADAEMLARRDLAAAKLEDYIERTVSSAPPLSEDQRQRLAALLISVPAGGDLRAS